MDCRNVQQHLNSRAPNDRIDSDPAVRAHLASCPVCAAEAERVRQLQQALRAAAHDDLGQMPSTAAHRAQVSSRLERRESSHRRRRHQLATGTAVATALLLVAFLAPWHQEPIDAYRMSVDGVSLELAADHEQLCDLLFALGAVNAAVDVGACDTTCSVVIYDLRTRDEARLVEAAIRKLSPGKVTVDVIPVTYRSAES